ncbi:MAG: hypothetical protein IH597_00415 [Bacteroidales bacterium]|nr:hypothetical protein [Bacteroidales bacterium]
MKKNITRSAASQNSGMQDQSKKDQKERICIVEKIQEFLEMVRNQVQAPTRVWEACPWLTKVVGADRQNPQVKN